MHFIKQGVSDGFSSGKEVESGRFDIGRYFIDVAVRAVAEIVDASEDGKTLPYSDSETGKLGFVDIKKPSAS
ncbi:MAG: hypothetical protein ACU826_04280 [Gammaproteobacteria bacterium]